MGMKAKRSGKGGLVLSRKPGESFQLFDKRDGAFIPIVITQRKMGGGKSSVHINAPEYVGILRSELAVKGIVRTELEVVQSLANVLAETGATEPC